MDIKRQTKMMKLLSDPDTRSVLEWYGLPINDRACLRYSLEEFCAANDVDVDDVVVELELLTDDAAGEAYEDDYDASDNWMYA